MESAVAGGAPDEPGSQSLAIGGTGASYAAFRDTAPAQRWGRWQRDAFKDSLHLGGARHRR